MPAAGANSAVSCDAGSRRTSRSVAIEHILHQQPTPLLLCTERRHRGTLAPMTLPESHDLALRMAELARTVASPRSLDDILGDVTAAAVELIPGVDTAGVLLLGDGGRFESRAVTDELLHKLDQLQITFNEGPCVQAALDDVVVRTDDFRKETRWPAYSPAVVQLGVLSGLSFKLYTADRTAGALNLFGFAPEVWDAEAETVGLVLASQAAAAILA